MNNHHKILITKILEKVIYYYLSWIQKCSCSSIIDQTPPVFLFLKKLVKIYTWETQIIIKIKILMKAHHLTLLSVDSIPKIQFIIIFFIKFASELKN